MKSKQDDRFEQAEPGLAEGRIPAGSSTAGVFNWGNAIFLITSPVIAFLGTGLYIYFQGFHWADLAIYAFFHVITGLAITAGYHRYFSHRAFECHPIVRFFFLVFGAAAFENSALAWCSDHRYHHRYVDSDADPYNIKRGFFWAHMGWIFFKPTEERTFDNVPYLKNDRLVMWQHRNYLPIAVISSFLLPTLVGACFGRPMAGFLWGGWLRIVFVHHGTFLINSASHYIGSRPHGDHCTARNCWWLAFFTFGEGFHNFHHTFASDYRNGYRWYHWDPTKWLIYSLSKVKLASRLNRIPKSTIQVQLRSNQHSTHETQSG